MKKTKRIVRDRRKMKGKRVIAGILLAGIIAAVLTGCKSTDNTKEEPEKPVITLGSDSYPPYITFLFCQANRPNRLLTDKRLLHSQ